MHVAREYVGNNADPVDGDCITGKTIGTIHERAGILEEVPTHRPPYLRFPYKDSKYRESCLAPETAKLGLSTLVPYSRHAVVILVNYAIYQYFDPPCPILEPFIL